MYRFLSLVFLCVWLSACAHYAPELYVPKEMPQAPELDDIEVALVLSGGGARGLAHVGVLSVLEEHNIPIDLVVGTSIGSIVGALYSDEPDSHKLREKMIHVRKWDVLDVNVNSSLRMLWGVGGIADGHSLRSYLHQNLRAQDFEDLKIPLAVVATDVDQGELVILRSGPIIPAAHASSAIPLIFNPVQIYDKTLVDGGVVSPVPVEVAKMLGAKKVIAVDIGAVVKPKKVAGTYELADRCLWLSYIALSQWQTQISDVVIEPQFEGPSLFDDTKLERYYQAGRQAAIKALPEIKSLIEHNS